MRLFVPAADEEKLIIISIPLNERSWSNAIYRKNYYLKKEDGKLYCTQEAYTWKELYEKGVREEAGIRIIPKKHFQADSSWFLLPPPDENKPIQSMSFKELKEQALKEGLIIPKSVRSKKELLDLITQPNNETD